MTDAYRQFSKRLAELNHYQRIMNLMSWDMYTQTPPLGYEGMSDTLTFFATRHFALSTDPQLLSLLEKLNEPEEYRQLNEGMQYTVRTMLRDIRRESRIPQSFIEKYVAAQSASRKAWEEAKRASDFSLFEPHLQRMIDMTIERCGYTDPGKEPYDVLLGLHEEGITAADIDRVFGELKEGLLPLLERILASKQPETSIYEGTYDPDDQKKVQELLLRYIGFSFDAGTVGESEHPFTTGFSRYDVRVTNHYYEHDPISSMFSAIHEGGHAIFEQNVDPALSGTAADDCCYMGIHESQSRFFENILGRRRAFWVPVYDQIQQLLPDLRRISLDEFIGEVNHIRCSYIRTQADEVTYCLHVILRYEVEQAVFRDHAKAKDLPALWNEKMQNYLHLTPRCDAEGILQDMHWSDASFGYFPSYLLGSIYDGMFLKACEKDLGSLDTLLENGGIKTVQKWLSEHIHRYGCLRLPKEIIANVCGEPLSAKPLLDYFTEKYTRICHL